MRHSRLKGRITAEAAVLAGKVGKQCCIEGPSSYIPATITRAVRRRIFVMSGSK
jgi:hypothetical protein